MASPEERSTQRQRLLVFFPSGHVFDTPCVPRLVLDLAQLGHSVDFLHAENSFAPKGKIEHPNVRQITFNVPFNNAAKERVGIFLLVGFVHYLVVSLRGNYDKVVAVGFRGLVGTGFLRLLKKTKICYQCLEIYPRRDGANLLVKAVWAAEAFFVNRIDSLIVQDSGRRDLFFQEVRVKEKPTVLIPNLPFAPESENIASSLKGYQSIGKKRIVYSGSLGSEWAGSPDILEALAEFLGDPRFEVHFQSREKLELKAFENLSNSQYENFKLNEEPLSAASYDRLLYTSYVGVAWYEPSCPNMMHVGLSSGKILHYLSKGLPIVVNRLPYWAEQVDRGGFGVIVDHPAEVHEAILRIDNNYDRFSASAADFFKKVASPSVIRSELTKI